MTDTQDSLECVLDTVKKANALLTGGISLAEVCERLQVDEATLRTWVTQVSLPPNSGDIMSSSRILDAVFPIFAAETDNSELDHIGSGVLIEIGDELFALTAAHVTDHSDGEGALFMPAVDAIMQMTGGLSFNPVEVSGTRSNDKGDMGYYHLSKEWRSKLHPSIAPLSIDDLLLSDHLVTGDLFTFAGFPWRKSKLRSGEFRTELVTYTGYASAMDVYNRLGYNRVVHVLMRMRREKTFSVRWGSHQTAPHPQGISGGAVVAWPSNFEHRFEASNLKLAAIGHTYHKKQHVMAGTRIIPHMMAIIRNNPELAVHFKDDETISRDFGDFLANQLKALNPSDLPSVVGISWFTNQTFQRCMQIFSDRSDFPETFGEWEALAIRTEQQLKAQGLKVVRVKIDPNTFPDWCQENRFERIDKHARMAFGNLNALKVLRTS